MPYIGARLKTGDFQINVKVYGFENTFTITDNEILSTIKLIALAEGSTPNSAMARELAIRLADVVAVDSNVTWIDCEVLKANGVSYGDIAIVREYIFNE